MRGLAIAAIGSLVACTAALPDTPNTTFGLYVAASVTPAVLSLRDSTTALQILITAENESSEPIIVVTGNPPVKIAPDPVNSVGLEYSYRIGRPGNLLNAGPASDSWGGQADTFPPRVRFGDEDQISLASWRGLGYPLDTGTYTLRSYYNGHEGRSATFRFVP